MHEMKGESEYWCRGINNRGERRESTKKRVVRVSIGTEEIWGEYTGNQERRNEERK